MKKRHKERGLRRVADVKERVWSRWRGARLELKKKGGWRVLTEYNKHACDA